MQTKGISTTSANGTIWIARAIGKRLRGGEVVELISDLGGGKTTFVRGLAEGLGSNDPVSSPSFTLTNEYTAGKVRIAHFDFYRLREPGILRDELAEMIHDPQTVVVIEWADIVEDVLPLQRLTIQFSVTDETKRRLHLIYPHELSYLVPEEL